MQRNATYFVSIYFSRLALDPAGPLLSEPPDFAEPTTRRLSGTDCLNTIAIYTDTNGDGSPVAYTNISIYADGGLNQNHCRIGVPSINLTPYLPLLPGFAVDAFPCRYKYILFLVFFFIA